MNPSEKPQGIPQEVVVGLMKEINESIDKGTATEHGGKVLLKDKLKKTQKISADAGVEITSGSRGADWVTKLEKKQDEAGEHFDAELFAKEMKRKEAEADEADARSRLEKELNTRKQPNNDGTV